MRSTYPGLVRPATASLHIHPAFTRAAIGFTLSFCEVGLNSVCHVPKDRSSYRGADQRTGRCAESLKTQDVKVDVNPTTTGSDQNIVRAMERVSLGGFLCTDAFQL